jgi:hypothetical protein
MVLVLAGMQPSFCACHFNPVEENKGGGVFCFGWLPAK